MSNLQRVKNIIVALLIAASAVFLMFTKGDGFFIIAIALGVALMLYGLKQLLFYATMARHMVGGKTLLFVGIIALDVGGISYVLLGASTHFIALYLIGCNLFSGVISILQGVDIKRLEVTSATSVIHGIICVLIAVACIVFINNTTVLVYLYCAGLLYTAATRFVSAFRTTDIVYIP